MDKVLLCCEVFIALFGVYAVLVADNTHERMHGFFVIGLAVEGFFSYLMGSEHLVTSTMLILLTVIAVFMIVMSFHSLVDHVDKLIHRAKRKKSTSAHPYLQFGDRHDVDKHSEMVEARFKWLEQILIDREKDIEKREADLLKREKMLLNKEIELKDNETKLFDNRAID